MTTKPPLEIAIDKAGGPSAFARLVGVTPQTVNNWRFRGVAAHACELVAKLTKHRFVTPRSLRPDFFKSKGTA